eukprot:5628958-Pyramimonas_sp.AAC.2
MVEPAHPLRVGTAGAKTRKSAREWGSEDSRFHGSGSNLLQRTQDPLLCALCPKAARIGAFEPPGPADGRK